VNERVFRTWLARQEDQPGREQRVVGELAGRLAPHYPPDRLITADELPADIRAIAGPADWFVPIEFVDGAASSWPGFAGDGAAPSAGLDRVAERWMVLAAHEGDGPLWAIVLAIGSEISHPPSYQCTWPERENERRVSRLDGGHVHVRSAIHTADHVTLGPHATNALIYLAGGLSHGADYVPTNWAASVRDMQAARRRYTLGSDGDLLPVIRDVAGDTEWLRAHEWLADPATWPWVSSRCTATARLAAWGALTVTVMLYGLPVSERVDWLADALVRLLHRHLAREITVVIADAATGIELGRDIGVF
jgi:hypothetical protein